MNNIYWVNSPAKSDTNYIMQKGKKPVLENRPCPTRAKEEVRLQNKKIKSKEKKVFDHRVPKILKINQNMLTLNRPANDKATGNLRYRESKTKNPYN